MIFQHIVALLTTRKNAAPFSRSLAMATAVLILPSCISQTVASQADREAALADEIEAKVVMPVGASFLNGYARFYAATPAGKIVGLYFRGVSDGLEPGARRWVPAKALPGVDDGGCAVVNVVFDVRTRKVEQAACNGRA
jgi:hypothetical protein